MIQNDDFPLNGNVRSDLEEAMNLAHQATEILRNIEKLFNEIPHGLYRRCAERHLWGAVSLTEALRADICGSLDLHKSRWMK